MRWPLSSGYKDHLEGEAEILRRLEVKNIYSSGTTILSRDWAGLTCEITTVPDVILVSPDQGPEL